MRNSDITLTALPPPAAVFAPYFYAEPTQLNAWIDVNLKLARVSAALKPPVPVHAVLLRRPRVSHQ